MSQQIQITGGAKVRNLEGVLTGTSGVVDALGINVPSGIPQLDGSGKILVSQLPNSVMEYKGSWNAATNTPTLVNGTGNAGDVYLCEVAGTVDFGAGPITFAVGDQVIYSGTIWQRASGATGTVTSVAVTESGDALTITGSPITTAGTINIGFAGTSGQYVNGAGGLTTFPSLTGFVPYTGATQSVNLGTYGLKAGLITTEGGYNFKILSSGTLFENGYSVLSSVTGNVSITQAISAGNLKTFTFDFSAWATNTSRTYTLPDLSGTLALLEGAQTFSGQKTFSTGIKAESGIFLKELSSSGRLAGYVGISATATGGMQQIQFLYPVSGSSVFSLPTTGAYNYEFPIASGTIALTSDIPSITGLVPYTGATANVNLGTFDLTADVITGATGSFASSGGSDTFAINHSSGSGIALNITKGGNGEGLYINKTSGSGNAATIIGTLNATTLVKSGGTSSQFLMADGSVNTSVLPSGAYLPLTGGTLTGTLNGTTATFSGTVSSIVTSGGTSFRVVNSVNSRAWSLVPSTNGAESDLWLYYGGTGTGTKVSFVNNGNVLIGSTTDSGELLQVNGTSKFTGALSGTSATFSSGLIVSNTSDVYPEFKTSAADADAFLGFSNTGDGNNAWGIGRRNTGEFWITNFTGNFNSGTRTTPFQIATTGAATFSSTLDTAGNITSTVGATNTSLKLIRTGNTFECVVQDNQSRIRTFGASGNDKDLLFDTDNAGTTRLFIKASNGNVGIGTSSPSSILTILKTITTNYGAKGNGAISLGTAGSANEANLINFGYDAESWQPAYMGYLCTSGAGSSNGALVFATRSTTTNVQPTERMRITSVGEVLVGTTSGFTSGLVCSDGGTSYVPFAAKVGTTASTTQIFFSNPNGVVGSITTSASLTSYNVTSDYRLKQDLKDYDALSLLSKIKTYDYEWKSDKSRMFGVVAHELAEVLPYAVQGEKDAKEMQQVDYSKLVPILVKAIQELKLEIEQLKNK
jgi:hypothetical protein